jgi:hypothetical protein
LEVPLLTPPRRARPSPPAGLVPSLAWRLRAHHHPRLGNSSTSCEPIPGPPLSAGHMTHDEKRIRRKNSDIRIGCSPLLSRVMTKASSAINATARSDGWVATPSRPKTRSPSSTSSRAWRRPRRSSTCADYSAAGVTSCAWPLPTWLPTRPFSATRHDNSANQRRYLTLRHEEGKAGPVRVCVTLLRRAFRSRCRLPWRYGPARFRRSGRHGRRAPSPSPRRQRPGTLAAPVGIGRWSLRSRR